MIIERNLYKHIEPVIDSPEAVIVTGMRRVGKTTLLQYIYEGIKSANKIFLDLENPVNRKYFEEEDYENIAKALEFLGLNVNKKGYVFLDEIHYVKEIPSVVKFLVDHYKIKFFMSGSASFYLKNLFTESLAGRKYVFELFPLDFREFLRIKGVKLKIPKNSSKITKPIFDKIAGLYDEYILYGGFPQVAEKSSIKEKKMMLEDIFSSYFQLEVTQLGDFRKINVIRDLMLLLMERTGSKLDISKLSRELGVSRITLEEYISFLENTYFIKLVRPYSKNRDTEIRSVPKFYLCDSGIVNHFAKISRGALFENNVFCLLRLAGEVNYYQKKSGKEIDFIVDKKRAYEAKNLSSKQDVERLARLSEELKLDGYKLISRRYCDLQSVTYGFML